MDEMDEIETYLGHAIRLAIKRLGADRFAWTYFIDSNYCFQSGQCLSEERSARDDALMHAHRSIERLLVIPAHHAAAVRSLVRMPER